MITGPGDRDRILARIRAALPGVDRRAGLDGVSDEPRGPIWGAPTARSAQDFQRAAEAVGVSVACVTSPVEARAAIAEILSGEGARSVVVSPGAASEPWQAAACSCDGIQFIARDVNCHAPTDPIMAADVGITTAEYGLADTGTLIVLSSPTQHRLDSLVPPVHIALLKAEAILPGLAELLPRLVCEGRFVEHSGIAFITGPSRTADIELTLTIGVHGPRKVYAVVLDR